MLKRSIKFIRSIEIKILTMIVSMLSSFLIFTIPAIKPYTEDYEVDENNGTVTVCLMKNVTTAVDFIVTFKSQEKTQPEAICKDYNSVLICWIIYDH